MRVYKFSLVLLSVFFISTSCKNDAKETTENTEVKRASKKELTVEDRKILGSVSTAIMRTPDTKEFARTLVSCQLVDMLSGEEGPYTVFAFSNEAFLAMPAEKKKFYSHLNNLEAFKTLIKNHIIEQDFNSSSLVQALKDNDEVALKMLGGATLTAKMDGSTIVLIDEKGTVAKIGKTDISGENGNMHVVDAVLNLD